MTRSATITAAAMALAARIRAEAARQFQRSDTFSIPEDARVLVTREAGERVAYVEARVRFTEHEIPGGLD